MEQIRIQHIDSTILLGYFLVTLFIGFFVSRRTKTGVDLFLAGNKLGWAAIGLSLFASNISTSTLIGLTGQAYLTGISISNYEWMATLVLIFIAVFVVPVYIKNKIKTVPEYLELRFNAFCRKYYSATTVILTLLVDISSSLFAGALAINLFYPQISVSLACYLIAIFCGIYTAAGGLAAVVYTDVLQTVVLLLASSIVLYATLGQFGFSWSEAMASLPADHKSLIRPANDPTLPWIGTLIGLPILGFYYWGTNQYVVQRILGARSLQAARWGTLFGGSLKLLTLFLIVIPGALALQIFPGISDSDSIFPTMLAELLPPGVLGLALAGLLAAIMSSVDSALNASSSLIVLDFIQPANPSLSEHELLRYGQITILLIMIAAGVWAPQIEHFSGLFNYLQLLLSYAVPPVVVVFIAGLFWKQASGSAASLTLVAGHGISLLALLLHVNGTIDIHFTIMAGILTLVCTILFIAANLCFQRSEISANNLIVAEIKRDEIQLKYWYKDYRFAALILVLITACIILIHW